MADTAPVKIFHNPRCTKSRQTLALLTEQGIEPEIVEYLDTPPSLQELDAVLTLLNLEPRQLMRQHEKEYMEAGLDDPNLGRNELIQLMVDNPKVIERPIVLSKGKAAIGRPPESVLDIL